ncbi:MAG: C-terminal target protein, partial [Phycisphaerales bacterium]|nr:C-terminal target protein [Phycisphaerales bacterium]
MTMRFSARPFPKRPATRPVRTAPRRLWLMDRLENRLMLAQFTDATPGLMLTLAANDAVAIMANPSTYTLNLTSGSWNGMDNAKVSGTGTATLTVQKAAFDQVSLTDSGAGTSVTFNDSGSDSYASSFNVALTNAGAGSIAFNGATSFTGSNTLSASTSDFIVANPGASVTTNSGGITLSANQQITPTSGTFIGIDINNATVQSATGGVVLKGTGGNSGSTDYGVEIQGGGKVQATGGPTADLSIT